MSEESLDVYRWIFKLEMFLRDPVRKRARKQFDEAIRNNDFEEAFLIVTNCGFSEEMALEATFLLSEYPDFYFEEIREKDIETPPLKKIKLDSAQAKEKLEAFAEVNKRLARGGPKPSYSRGVPADKNKPTTGKRRTLQYNPGKKKS